MNSNNFWKLLGGLGLSFFFPWLFLIVIPFIDASNAEPIPYGEGDEIAGGVVSYPNKAELRHGASDYGREIYAAEGCSYCHTQVIRPTYAGPDMWRVGWGGREEEEGGFARETQPMDYATETFAPLGYQRIGQDLSNVGHRIEKAAREERERMLEEDPSNADQAITARELMHRHLSDPKGLDPDSGMPAYLHLYEKSPYREGLVPTPEAEALVDYLLSLKKDQPLPASMRE